MTSRELYEYALIECNKSGAPSLILEDYLYFINKAIQQYINITYPKLEFDQQSTDDLRVIQTTAILTPKPLNELENYSPIKTSGEFKSTYYVELPKDYLHLIACFIEYENGNVNAKCYDADEDPTFYVARRLTSELQSQIRNNAYLKPCYNRPYYYIHNYNTSVNGGTEQNPTHETDLPSNSAMDDVILSASYADNGFAEWGSYPIDAYTAAGDRLANVSNVILELKLGKLKGFIPKKVYVDYLKAPMYVRLTQDQINSVKDTSQVLEFPDYVCYEIVNIFTKLIMENAGDPRIQTHYSINQTITNPQLQTTVK